MKCFDVFIIVLVIVIFLVDHLHHDNLVTTFKLSDILTNTLKNIFFTSRPRKHPTSPIHSHHYWPY